MENNYWEYTTPQDQYFNYCLWSYNPVAPVENKFRSTTLLFQSFISEGLDENIFQIVRSIQQKIGLFQTVWGIKWLGDKIVWEFYFYDYRRRERTVSITKVLEAISSHIHCNFNIKETFPYFMFSIDINPEIVSKSHTLDQIHMYIGNPGSKVSSGIAYHISNIETRLENFYFFFGGIEELSEAAAKICCSAHINCQEIDVNQILLPELRNCHTICIANKQYNDTVYFSGINIHQLLFFLKRLNYPKDMVQFVENNQNKLDHLLYDVGFDYKQIEHGIEIIKSGYYGIF
jgi:hypothetical protein